MFASSASVWSARKRRGANEDSSQEDSQVSYQEYEEDTSKLSDGDVDGDVDQTDDNDSPGGPSHMTTLQHIRDENKDACWFCMYQAEVYDFYKRDKTQWFVASLIILNFLFQCAQREIIPNHERLTDTEDGDTDPRAAVFKTIGNVFNVIFLIELLVNMYGSWFWRFITVGWNQFDCIVVGLGCLDLLGLNPGGPLKMIRMLRAFRIFRLFGKVESLRKIFESIRLAAGGVTSTLVILVIMIAIAAVLAVDCFSDIYAGPDCTSLDTNETAKVAITAREKCFGPDYYGSFVLAFWTMFQIMSGDSWSEAAVRPALHYYRGDTSAFFGTMLFFAVFVVGSSLVLVNLFVAALLDGMNNIEPQQSGGEHDDKERHEKVKTDLEIKAQEMKDFKKAVVNKVDSLIAKLDQAMDTASHKL